MQYTREQLQHYERLFGSWCEAEKNARDALVSLVNDELSGRPIDAERRKAVEALEQQARNLLVDTVRASPSALRS